MRTTAFLILLVCLVVVVDVTYICLDQVRDAHRRQSHSQFAIATEDLKYGVFLSAGLALCAFVWLLGASVSPQRRVSRLVFPSVRGSIIGAAIVGGLFALGVGLWHWLEGESAVNHRYEWETRWLIGSVVGAISGGAIGAGLGVVAYVRGAKQSNQRGSSEVTATGDSQQQA